VNIRKDDHMRIIFIGNSHTYMNDMPQLVSEMIESATGEKCEVVMLAYSARSLKWHMGEEYFSERFNILHGKYDYCIIQEHAHPMTDEADTIAYAARIIELCKKANTVPVIFETWAEKVKPENQTEMNRRYQSLAKDQGALLAPIGEVWSSAMNELQDSFGVDLYYRDGEHASAIGDFLVSMVLTKLITGKLPSEDFLKAYDFTIPDQNWFPVKEDIDNEIVSISKDVATVIRKHVSAHAALPFVTKN
jgi:hypothetical protein